MSRNKVLIVGLLTFPSVWGHAAEADRMSASIRKLAVSYEQGRGVQQDCRKAFKYYRRAADMGDAYSRRMVKDYQDAEAFHDSVCNPEPKFTSSAFIDSPGRKFVESWVNKIAPVYGIDPNLVLAVIQTESAFNQKALSSKNAQGLMQLIPATAERFGVRDVWNPVQNITGGTAYLSWLIHHFSGNVELVLAAYNAGEEAVERYQGVPPYEETRNYVRRIQALYKKTTHPIPAKPIGNIAPIHQAVLRSMPGGEGDLFYLGQRQR
ncbi:lytic transglycosylase domain-containing protein [Methylobacter sp. BlB1]|uniref:lytic transglycosylase domain-containing protein n=1 Tax=Methylobacter sp. BlB1 TaxID=2785914 RepID=UPI0018946AA5|nr:lytic transglycosylase domain-containing protein [Methylobacter sp. BlB1]MBF6649689.1 lytic transglycosylase domain-containing protein [Methylobacter sp. BlB1]